MLRQVSFTIDRFEGDLAVLREKDHEVLWPKDLLPKGVGEGSVLLVQLMDEVDTEKSRAALAKDILNDILGEDKVSSVDDIDLEKRQKE